MERMVLRPEAALKTLWFIGWWIWFVAATTLWVLLLIFVPASEVPKWLWCLFLAVSLVVLGLVALWIPAYWRSIEYVIGTERVRSQAGVFWRKNVTVPFSKITNVDVTQGPLQRAFGVGLIHVQTAGAGGQQGARAELLLVGMRDLEGIRETIVERAHEHPAAQVVGEAGEVGGGQDSKTDVFGDILGELRAIRGLLEREQRE